MEDLYNVEDQVLANGLKVIYAPDNSNPLVSVHIYMRIGSAWEEESEAGFSHFAEHLVFKSTSGYPEGGLLDRIAFLGGSINAYTEYDSTCYYLEISSRYLRESLQILSELVQQPDFSEKDFRSEKLVIFEELKEADNDPEDYLVEKIAQIYLSDNPYNKPIAGNLKNLKKAKRIDLQEFIQRHYFPGNSVLVIAGDFERQELDGYISEYFGNWQPKQSKPRKVIYGGYPTQFEFHTIKHSAKSEIMAVAFPTLADSQPENIALSLVHKAFCLGKNSFAYEELFKRKQLIESMKVDSISGINDGLSVLLLFPRRGVALLELIRAFQECWQDFCCRGISAVQLMKLRAQVMNSFRISREYVDSFASSLGMEEIVSDYKNYFSYPDKLKQLTRLDLRNVIDKWLTPDQMGIYYQGRQQVKASDVGRIFEISTLKPFLKSDKGYYQRQLSNGTRVLYYRIKGKPVTGISATFNVSQLYENASERGLNFLTGTLMLYGNKLYSYDKFLDFCSLHGISIKINPHLDMTTIRAKCFNEDIALAMEALSALIYAPELPRQHFDIIKNSILSSWNRVKDYPQRQAVQFWKKMAFGSQSRLFSREGLRNEFNQQSLSKVKRWHSDNYTADNLNLVIAGELDFEAIDKIVDKYFAAAASKKVSRSPHYEVYPSINHKKIKDNDSSQGVIVLGGFGPGWENMEEVLWITVLCQILGGDTNSLLFNELREKHGLAYSVEMEYFTWRKQGAFISSAVVDRNNSTQALKLIKKVLHQTATEGVSEYELTKIKNHLAGQMLQQEESVSEVAVALGHVMTMQLGLEHFFERYSRLEAVNSAQIKFIAQKYLKEDNFFVQVLK